jgi:hypothetical protein
VKEGAEAEVCHHLGGKAVMHARHLASEVGGRGMVAERAADAPLRGALFAHHRSIP